MKAVSIRSANVACLAAATCVAGGLLAQAAEPPAEASALRAEIGTARTLFSPGQPVRLRFTLFNSSAEPVEVPAGESGENASGITLPRELIFGTADHPALFVSYENEKPTPILPAASSQPAADSRPAAAAAGALRLAGQAVLGAEVDLRAVYRQLRYSGRYRLEWRPLDGKVQAASAEFRVERRKNAILVTDVGKITFALLYDQAPRNVENFLELVRERFYDGKTIHRIVSDFILQGGSPDGSETGTRPDGKTLPAEFHDAPFTVGTLAMARKPSDPNSASCQFFVSLTRLPELDGQYTVIGQASDEESLRTLKQIAEIPTNERGRPLRSVVIRFLTLVDAELPTERLEVAQPSP